METLESHAPSARSTLAFDTKGGPLVAVGGLVGGAGTTTITYLLAAAAARDSSVPIIALDHGGPNAALALYAGTAAPRPLTAAANRLAKGAPLTGGLFAQGEHGLRLIATAPEIPNEPAPDEALDAVLGDAKLAHGLTAVDCGTLTQPSQVRALEHATHVIWTLPATSSAARRAAAALRAVGAHAPQRQTIVARNEPGAERARLQELDVLAEETRGELIFVPHVDDLAEQPVDVALAETSLALNALGRALHR